MAEVRQWYGRSKVKYRSESHKYAISMRKVWYCRETLFGAYCTWSI